ncbi:hypothetical protein BHE74_00013365 [Ensete ventricosum]|nr:hypothetical protein GW17_00039118 [Ensete ventricosum]RWW78414.1 hypothetical protein BHE74_00013365 [Ensete ventricosum]RZR91832.1 hypothetical protein BHM03_00020016 [Ensete ventricosum]
MGRQALVSEQREWKRGLRSSPRGRLRRGRGVFPKASNGLGGVLVVRGLFPRFVVGYLQEKTSVGAGPPNEVPPMAKLAL